MWKLQCSISVVLILALTSCAGRVQYDPTAPVLAGELEREIYIVYNGPVSRYVYTTLAEAWQCKIFERLEVAARVRRIRQRTVDVRRVLTIHTEIVVIKMRDSVIATYTNEGGIITLCDSISLPKQLIIGPVSKIRETESWILDIVDRVRRQV